MKIILVLPVHDEEAYVSHAINKLEAVTRGRPHDFVLVLAEDGSEDRTYQVAIKTAEEYENVKVLHYPVRLGRGKAVRRAFSLWEGDIYIFMDADLAVDLRHLETLIDMVDNGYDMVTGSRYVRQSVTKRPLLRKTVSLAYNLIVRGIFRTGIHDHQCGFKAINKRFRNFLINYSHSNHWFWDTEMFILAKRNGFRVAEFPVTWLEKRSKRTPIRRLIRDIILHSEGIIYHSVHKNKLKA